MAELTMMQGVALDMAAEGKSARAIAEVLNVSPSQALKLVYDLLDSEIITDVDQRRKLNVYRLEKIVEALWNRVMKNADKDDVKNLVDVLDKLNVLLGLNKERDEEAERRMEQRQLFAYMSALKGLIIAFQSLAPEIMSAEEWSEWAATQLEQSQKILELEGNPQ